jgi:hypothetical protein
MTSIHELEICAVEMAKATVITTNERVGNKAAESFRCVERAH